MECKPDISDIAKDDISENIEDEQYSVIIKNVDDIDEEIPIPFQFNSQINTPLNHEPVVDVGEEEVMTVIENDWDNEYYNIDTSIAIINSNKRSTQ